jgi:hypothetical protein
MRKLLCLGCLLLPLIVQAAADTERSTAYRWVDKDGSVHFSSTPPPPGVKATEIELRQPQTVIHQENRSQMLKQGRMAGERSDARQDERQRLIQQIDDAKAALAQANEALIKGEEPQPGELQHLAGGGNRLSDAYHQRRAAEARRIEQLQQQLDELYGQLNKLR